MIKQEETPYEIYDEISNAEFRGHILRMFKKPIRDKYYVCYVMRADDKWLVKLSRKI